MHETLFIFFFSFFLLLISIYNLLGYIYNVFTGGLIFFQIPKQPPRFWNTGLQRINKTISLPQSVEDKQGRAVFVLSEWNLYQEESSP